MVNVKQSNLPDDETVHVPMDIVEPESLPLDITMPLDEGAEAWNSAAANAEIVALLPETVISMEAVDRLPVAAKPAFPCLQGVRYTGCIGEDCPLATCWTGTPTLGHNARHHRPPGTANEYVGEALCHSCVHVITREPRLPLPPHKSAGPVFLQQAPPDPVGDKPTPLDQSRWSAVRNVVCARDKWRFAITMQSYLSLRVPIRDEVDAAHCPSYEDAGALRPEVVAYRESRRQTMRDYRDRLKLDRLRPIDPPP